MERHPSTRKAERIGLPPNRTNLPCVLWLLRARPDLPGIAVQVTPTTLFEQPTLYEVQPWLHRVNGPYRFQDLATLGRFVRDNMAVIERFWLGGQGETTQQAENRHIAAAIKPLPAHTLDWALNMAERIAPGSTKPRA